MECHGGKWHPASERCVPHKVCQTRQGSQPPLHCRAVLVIWLHHDKNHCPLSAQKMHRAKSSRTCQKYTHPLAACWVLNGIPWCGWPWTDLWGPRSPVADAGLHVIFQSIGVLFVVWALDICVQGLKYSDLFTWTGTNRQHGQRACLWH